MSKAQEKIIIGIDLAAIPKNPTGWALWKNREVSTSHLYKNEEIIKQGIEVIEVHPTSTRKALKMPEKDWDKIQNILVQRGLEGDLKTHQLTPYKIDAVTAALTAHLRLQGKTEEIGNQDGCIVVPIKTDWRN